MSGDMNYGHGESTLIILQKTQQTFMTLNRMRFSQKGVSSIVRTQEDFSAIGRSVN